MPDAVRDALEPFAELGRNLIAQAGGNAEVAANASREFKFGPAVLVAAALAYDAEPEVSAEAETSTSGEVVESESETSAEGTVAAEATAAP